MDYLRKEGAWRDQREGEAVLADAGGGISEPAWQGVEHPSVLR